MPKKKKDAQFSLFKTITADVLLPTCNQKRHNSWGCQWSALICLRVCHDKWTAGFTLSSDSQLHCNLHLGFHLSLKSLWYICKFFHGCMLLFLKLISCLFFKVFFKLIFIKISKSICFHVYHIKSFYSFTPLLLPEMRTLCKGPSGDTYSLPSVLNRNSFWRWQAKYWDLGFLLLVSLLLFCSVWSLKEPGRPLSSVKGECPCLRGGERRASEVPLLFREGA